MFINFKKKIAELKDIINIRKTLFKLNSSNTHIFFFFPYFHIGGAEKVHLSILEIFASYKPLCFITTSKSKNNFFYQKFSNNATIILLGSFLKEKLFKTIIIKKIAKKINNTNHAIIFGCNSQIFYDLIPHLNNNIKIIDLIHAFSERGMENYSIPFVKKISKRVVLGENTKQNFIKLYSEQKIPIKFVDRIVIIRNKLEIPQKVTNKNYYSDVLEILFIGRNSPEKQFDLFLNIAKQCYELKLPVVFNVVGDFENFKHNVPRNINIVGLLQEQETINSYYEKSHILLLTSYSEGFPLVIQEAMVYGVVVISTDVGEINSLINPLNNNGILIPNFLDKEKTIIEFIEKIKLLLENRKLLQQYSNNSILTVKTYFNNEKFKTSYIKLFFNEYD